MFDDLKYLIKDAKVPETTKLALSVLIKAIGWFAVAFVVITILLLGTRQYFIYWLAFFLFVEGLLVVAVISVLLMAVRSELPTSVNESSIPDRTSRKGKFRIGDVALHGIVGHAAFYLLILVVLIVLGAMGVFEDVWKIILHKASK